MNSQSAADCSRLTKISKPDTGCPSCSPQSHSTAVFSTPIEVAMPSPCSVLRRSEAHTSELQSLMRISYAVFCLTIKTSSKSSATHRSQNLHITHYSNYSATFYHYNMLTSHPH